MEKPIQVLVVDDSALMRNLISKMLVKDLGIEVVATAMNGQFALKKINSYDIDVITLDLEMPVLDGLGFLKERKNLGIDIPVIVFSSKAQSGARITMEALALNASDFICKPSGPDADIHEMETRLVELVKFFGERYRKQKRIKEIKSSQAPVEKLNEESKVTILKTVEYELREIKEEEIKVEAPRKIPTCETVEIVAIGVSTGGPNALRQILPVLDKNLQAPVVIVQHMPPGFTEELAKSLDRICPLEVKEAKEGDIIRSGRILIAPGGYHLTIEKRPLSHIVRLSHTDAVNGHRPSVDVLFASIADIYHNNCLAVIMTGMGKDGVKEIGTIYNNGGITIAQEESSCIVPGMPGAAIRSGCINYIVPLDAIAENINKYVLQHSGAAGRLAAKRNSQPQL